MIDIKVIKKPKNEGGTSALRTSGTAYGGMAVKEAAHAAKADIAELAKEATHAKDSDHALEADHSKEADHAVNADESKHALEADHAKEADNADKWDYREFDDYLNQPVRKTDGVTFDSVTSDSIRSAGQFVDGMLGAGFQLWKGEDGRTYLTVDKLTVRQTMAVMELLIEKVRSVGGQICVSAANGRIKTVEGEGYRPKLEALINRTIKKVGEDIDALKANTAIAQLMILVNALYDEGGATRAEYEVLLQLLNPFAPHMTEELWEKLGHSHDEQLAYYPWPQYEEAKCVEATVEIAVQVNGKVKARLKVAADITSEDAIAAAKAEPAVAEVLAGKTIVKEIYVKGRLVNLAAKG